MVVRKIHRQLKNFRRFFRNIKLRSSHYKNVSTDPLGTDRGSPIRAAHLAKHRTFLFQVFSDRICLTLILLTSTKWWAPASDSKWRMGFNSAFKGLIHLGAGQLHKNSESSFGVTALKGMDPFMPNDIAIM
jgi:hypothetical protein